MSPTTANQTTTHERTGTEAQDTFTGAPEPEPVSEVEQSKYAGGVKQSEVGSGAGVEGAEGETQGKLPFKEQVKAYAKVHRGTVRSSLPLSGLAMLRVTRGLRDRARECVVRGATMF